MKEIGMALNRNNLLDDIRDAVIDITATIDTYGGKQSFRCTLRPDMLPASYSKMMTEEKTFHENNPKLLRVWNVNTSSWFQFNIDEIIYTEDVNYNY